MVWLKKSEFPTNNYELQLVGDRNSEQKMRDYKFPSLMERSISTALAASSSATLLYWTVLQHILSHQQLH